MSMHWTHFCSSFPFPVFSLMQIGNGLRTPLCVTVILRPNHHPCARVEGNTVQYDSSASIRSDE